MNYSAVTFDTAGRIYCAGRRVVSVYVSTKNLSPKKREPLVRCAVVLEDTNPLVLDTLIRSEDLDLCKEYGVPIRKATDWPDDK